ncbi:hypothetical protein GCM10027176_72700 [Actinoallomurus bryophytorum]|uniref:Putative membrane protein DUF2207 n=1 Tax=Actinoallomurus bryophytorum TaxID=1490222 RepID=A0A543CVI8_9ACTN|nr:DUF2207 domain-containing protein [Actinoallomurus bryophytorum]TQM01112.1 putative membrane protein DUF2207 [Actinoallomurus bryophytorum]
MRRRDMTGVLAGLITVLFVTAPAAHAEAPAPPEHIEAYDVALRVRPDGDMHVTETIKYDFGSASGRHGIVRRISTRRQVSGAYDRVISIRGVRARTDPPGGDGLAVGKDGDEEVLKIGDQDATVTGAKTYVIDYDVPRVLLPGTRQDELYWNAIGTGWNVPISRATLTVSAPVPIAAATCYRGHEDSTTPCPLQRHGTTMTATGGPLRARDGITVRLRIPHRAGVISPELVRRPDPFGPTAAAGIAVLLAAALAGGMAWLFAPRPMRERPADPASPPEGIAPGLAGLLGAGGTLSAAQLNAVLLDLAVRGHLRFEEAGRHEIRIVGGDGTGDELAPYESAAVQAVVGRDGRPITATGMRSGGRRSWAHVAELLRDEATERGWYRWRLRTQRLAVIWLIGGTAAAGAALLVVAGLFGAIAGVPTAGLGWGGLAFLLASVAVAFLGGRPALTAAGRRKTAEVGAYADALARWPGRREDADLDTLSHVFPYAVALERTNGFAGLWATAIVRTGGVPSWYAAAETSRETGRRIRALAGLVADPRPAARVRRRNSWLFGTGGPAGVEIGYGQAAGLEGAGGGFSGSGGGAVGGGDGGGGGGSW